MGIEPSGEFCKYAKENFNIDVSQGYLTNNSFPHNSFDLITLHHVLEHVDEPGTFLPLISLFLKDDGLVFIEVPNANSTLHQFVDFYFKIRGLRWSSRLSPLHPPFHKYGYSEKSLKYLLKKCHFKIIAVKTYPEADRDNSGSHKKKNLFVALKKLLSTVVDLFGNRELISVIAKPERIRTKENSVGNGIKKNR